MNSSSAMKNSAGSGSKEHCRAIYLACTVQGGGTLLESGHAISRPAPFPGLGPSLSPPPTAEKMPPNLKEKMMQVNVLIPHYTPHKLDE